MANAQNTMMQDVHLKCFVPKENIRVSTHGKTHVVKIDATKDKPFSLSNHGTLESDTQVNVHGNQVDHGQAKDHERVSYETTRHRVLFWWKEVHRKIDEKYQTPEVCETVGKTLSMHIQGDYTREGSKTLSKDGTVIQIGVGKVCVKKQRIKKLIPNVPQPAK